MSQRPRYDRGQVTFPPPKESRQCCVAQRDQFGRLPIGRCGPGCLGHPKNWLAHLTRKLPA